MSNSSADLRAVEGPFLVQCGALFCDATLVAVKIGGDMYYFKSVGGDHVCPLRLVATEQVLRSCRPPLTDLYSHSDPSVIDAVERVLGHLSVIH